MPRYFYFFPIILHSTKSSVDYKELLTVDTWRNGSF